MDFCFSYLSLTNNYDMITQISAMVIPKDTYILILLKGFLFKSCFPACKYSVLLLALVLWYVIWCGFGSGGEGAAFGMVLVVGGGTVSLVPVGSFMKTTRN